MLVFCLLNNIKYFCYLKYIMLNSLITSKTRLRLLIKFFISQANRGYLNGLANEMGESTNSIRKELNHLYDAGYLEKVKNDNKVEYKVNSKHPLYSTLKKVVYKHLGLEDLVDTGESIPETKNSSTGTTQFLNIKKIHMRKKYLFHSQKDCHSE